MHKLKAIAPLDGWGYVEENGTLYLIKPPYDYLGNKIAASKSQLEAAVSKHGFEVCEKSFASYSDLFGFLNDTYKTSNANVGRVVSPVTSKDVIAYIGTLPDDMIEDYAVQIEKQLLASRQYDAAQRLAEDVLQVETVKNSVGLEARFESIIETARREKSQQAEKFKTKWDIPNLDNVLLATERICNRQSVLEMC
jgi:hypothetical protein